MHPKKKIVVFYSQAGGGHENMAKIIQREIGDTHDVVLKNIAENNKLLGKVLDQGYVWITEKAPLLWAFFSIIWKQNFLCI